MDEQTRKDIRAAFCGGDLLVEAVPPTGLPGWFPIMDVLQHDVPQKGALRVVLEDGAEVTVTEDHSLFKGLEPIQAGDLRVGDTVTVVRDGVVGTSSVASVDKVSGGVMYDLSVPGPENFTLTNGILAHNSYSIGGVSLDIDKSSKYESASQAANEQFNEMLEKAKQTRKIAKGLQQPRFGIGVRSAFGPYVGRGVLTPRKFAGF